MESATRATRGAVCPTAIVAVAGLTVIVATGTADIVTRQTAVLPSLVAVIVAVPGAIASTAPVDETLAIVGAFVLHATARPVSTRPAESRTATVSESKAPSSSAAVVGVITSVATGTGCTETSAVPLTPPDDAAMVALPGESPVTRPALLTDATVALAELH